MVLGAWPDVYSVMVSMSKNTLDEYKTESGFTAHGWESTKT